MINLNDRRQNIIDIASEIFNKILLIDGRQDDKVRTGIQILVREVDTRNLVFISMAEPSEAAKFFAIEKAVRSGVLCDATSQDSEDCSRFQFSGSIMLDLANLADHPENVGLFQASVSGLKPEEDVLVAMVILAKLFELPFCDLHQNIETNLRALPKVLFTEDHYLNLENFN